MKIHLIVLVCAATLLSISCFAKRPKKEKPQHDHTQKIDDIENQKEPRVYQPNPVVLAGVGQIMNGALSIAQDPHSRPNVGHSIAHIIHGILTIIIEKIANKKIDMHDRESIEECFNELCGDISNEITEIIASKNLLIHDNYS